MRLPLAVLLAAPIACSSPPPAAPQGATTSAQAQRPQATRTATTPPSEPAPEDAPDPEAQRLFQKRFEERALQLSALTPPRVTAIRLDETARGEAAGRKVFGEITGAKLTEGQRAMTQVTLAPGECATFIGVGGLGVIEVDAFLVVREAGTGVRILAQDPSVGPIAVIGGQAHCYRNAQDTPLAAELHVSVRRGAGVVLVRQFRGSY